eukprot:EG_transcript_24578
MEPPKPDTSRLTVHEPASPSSVHRASIPGPRKSLTGPPSRAAPRSRSVELCLQNSSDQECFGHNNPRSPRPSPRLVRAGTLSGSPQSARLPKEHPTFRGPAAASPAAAQHDRVLHIFRRADPTDAASAAKATAGGAGEAKVSKSGVDSARKKAHRLPPKDTLSHPEPRTPTPTRSADAPRSPQELCFRLEEAAAVPGVPPVGSVDAPAPPVSQSPAAIPTSAVTKVPQLATCPLNHTSQLTAPEATAAEPPSPSPPH